METLPRKVARVQRHDAIRRGCLSTGAEWLVGPIMFFILPIIERTSIYVDQRVRVASVTAESTLTRDTVPVNVDAIIFWMVWNAEKSILEVEDFIQAINMSAQTALWESIGRHELARWGWAERWRPRR